MIREGKSDAYFKILIYVPSFDRPETCLNQVRNLSNQIRSLEGKKLEISLMLSVNNDESYDELTFGKYVSEFLNLPFNYGASLNISFGFHRALVGNFDYLWIVGDDEPLPTDALEIICSAIFAAPETDLIVGSKDFIGLLESPTSFIKMNKSLGGSLSFITSTIYKVKFTQQDFLKAMEFEWTQFPHLVLLNRLIERKEIKSVFCIQLKQICHVDQRIHGYPAPSRSKMGFRDSAVFFGKILSNLGVETEAYRKLEFTYWFRDNWHRISMYRNREDFRGLLAYGLAKEISGLNLFIILSNIPFWRIKAFVMIKRTRRKA
jgi:hypothetical protein